MESTGTARMRRAEAREVPGRIDEGVHGVGLARGRPAAARAGDVLPGRMAVERIAGCRRSSRLRAASPAGPSQAPARCRTSRNGSSGSGSPNSAAARCPSRAGGTRCGARLAARPSTVFSVRCVGDLLLGRLDAEAVEKARIDQRAVAGIGLIADGEALRHRRRAAAPPGSREARSAAQIRGRADRAPGSRRWRRCRTP